KGPIQAHVEMDLTPEEAVERLRETGYEPLFAAAFPGEEEPLTFDNIAKAIAAFERTLITPGAPFDRYLAGDTTALTPLQKRGLAIFQGAGCIGCHHGVLLGGNGYAAFTHARGSGDVGRAAVTGREEDRYVFRIAPLRNVALTAPYFHDGSAATLHDAVSIMGRVQLNQRFTEEEVEAVVAFLESLTGEFPLIPHPQLPRVIPANRRAAAEPADRRGRGHAGRSVHGRRASRAARGARPSLRQRRRQPREPLLQHGGLYPEADAEPGRHAEEAAGRDGRVVAGLERFDQFVHRPVTQVHEADG